MGTAGAPAGSVPRPALKASRVVVGAGRQRHAEVLGMPLVERVRIARPEEEPADPVTRSIVAMLCPRTSDSGRNGPPRAASVRAGDRLGPCAAIDTVSRPRWPTTGTSRSGSASSSPARTPRPRSRCSAGWRSALEAAHGAVRHDSRPMKGWILVAPEGVRTKRQLGGSVARGVQFAASLPPQD
jgi:hypothetical protein